MSVAKISVFVLTILTGACSNAPTQSSSRYQFIAASGNMPAIIFDTHTSCFVAVKNIAIGDSAKDAILVRSNAVDSNMANPKRCATGEMLK